jgi:hypothetical protein
MPKYYICQNGNYGHWQEYDTPEAAVRGIVADPPMSNVYNHSYTRYTVYLASDVRRNPQRPAHLILPEPLLDIRWEDLS